MPRTMHFVISILVGAVLSFMIVWMALNPSLNEALIYTLIALSASGLTAFVFFIFCTRVQNQRYFAEEGAEEARVPLPEVDEGAN